MLPEGVTVHEAILALDAGQKRIGQALLDLRQEIGASGKVGPRAQGIGGIVQSIVEAVGPLLKNLQGPTGESQMTSRLMNMAFSAFEENIQTAQLMKLGIAKQLGVSMGELPARHVVVHG